MSKKVLITHNTSKVIIEEKRNKQREEKCEYLGINCDKMLDAIEEIFNKAVPTPTGADMIDMVSLAAVFVFARQIRMGCKGKKAMQSVMKSAMWALEKQIEAYAEPFIKEEEPWDEMANEEGGENGRTKS